MCLYFPPQPDWDRLVERECVLGIFCVHDRTYLTVTYFAAAALAPVVVILLLHVLSLSFNFHALHLADLRLAEVEV